MRLRRYVVGDWVDASAFRFWTAHGASKFLSRLKRAGLYGVGDAPPVHHYGRRSGWRRVG